MSTKGLVLEGLPEIGPAGVRVDYQAVGFGSGGVAQGAFDDARVITCVCRASATAPMTIATARAAMAGWWRYLRRDTAAALLFGDSDGLDDRYWMARLQGEPSVERQGVVVRATLEWLCADPHAYGTTERTPAIADLSADDTVEVTYLGDADAFPVYVITNTGSSITGVTLANTASGETLTWSGTLATNEKLRVTAATERCERWNGSAWVSADVYAATSSKWPRLIPAGNASSLVNPIVVGGVSAGDLAITYRDRWLA